MVKLLRRVCVGMLLLFSLQAMLWREAAAQDTARMEQIIQSHVADRSFMGTVLVTKDGHALLDKGYGSADLEWQIPNAPDVKFRLGLLTKQFTAASILLLEERGKLKVSDPVSKYLPDAPPAWSKITLYQLLTHTSGIPNFTNFPEYRSTEWKDTTPKELVDRFRDKPLDFEPGSKFSYSNSGYILLGYLLEKISGQTYGDFLQQTIFKPLAMADTGMDNTRMILPKRAQGYAAGPAGLEHAGYTSMTIPFSAGALYSTTSDLAKWETGLYGGKLLAPASLTQMTTPYKEGYGFGIFIATKDGHKSYSHGGGIEGFNTSLTYYPDDKLAIVVLSNVNGGAPDAIADALGRIAFGGKVTLPSERTVVEVPVATLAQYAGTYQLSPDFALTFTVENGQLMTQATHQAKLPTYAESQTRFFLKVVDAEVEFFRNPSTHQVDHIVLYQGGEHEGKKQ